MGDSIFAKYLSHLDQWGEPQNRQLFDDMWIALRRAVRRELTRRDLWRLPPGYLGIYGAGSWTEEALDDLAHDCYVFVIHERRRALIAQLRVRTEIDGLIIRNLRNFLFETQRKHDPLGFRVFELLQLAARKNLAAGALKIISGDQRIRNNTIMELSTLEAHKDSKAPLLPFDSSLPAGTLACAHPEFLKEVAVSWCDELLPDLVTIRGPAVTSFVQNLQVLFCRLADKGVMRLRFGDLVGAVKTETRSRWTAISQLDMQNRNPILNDSANVALGADLIQLESYRLLLDGLEDSVQTWPGRSSTQVYLSRLLTFLCHHANESNSPDQLPSFRSLSDALKIPRERFKKLFTILRQMVEDNTDPNEPPPTGQLSAHFLTPSTLNERASP